MARHCDHGLLMILAAFDSLIQSHDVSSGKPVACLHRHPLQIRFTLPHTWLIRV
jgi:hypothetical protein